ncbi:MAG: hypothetical protein AAFV53_19490 [Myxococcota bacterium]
MNRIQTAAEAAFANDSRLLEQVKGIFTEASVGQCPSEWNKVTEVVHWPILGPDGSIRQVPMMVIAQTCNFGNFNVVQTTLPIVDPLLESAPKSVRVCTTGFQVRDTREITLKHTFKSTKVGLGFGLGFLSLPTGGLFSSSPTKGETVHGEDGAPKKDPTTGKDITFDIDFMKIHASLKLRAWQELVLDVGPEMFVCRGDVDG